MTVRHDINLRPQCEACPMLIACEQNLELAEENERRIVALGRTALNSAKQVTGSVMMVFGNSLLFFNDTSEQSILESPESDYDRARQRTLRCQADLEQIETVIQYDCPGVKQSSRLKKLVSLSGLVDAAPVCQNPHFNELSYRLRVQFSNCVTRSRVNKVA